MPQPDHIATVGIAAFIKDDALPEAASKDLRGISPMRPKPRRTSSGSEFNQITNVVQARMVALRCTIWSPSPVRLDMADALERGDVFRVRAVPNGPLHRHCSCRGGAAPISFRGFAPSLSDQAKKAKFRNLRHMSAAFGPRPLPVLRHRPDADPG